MKSTLRTRALLLSVASGLALTLSACSSADSAEPAAADTGSMESSESSAAPMSDEPFGPGCSAVPADGEGSFDGMTDDPVATAASNNPALSTLVTAVGEAGLADSLNSAEDITVLAPANAAFEAVPADALNALLADKEQLTAVLTHHVIEGRLAPEDLAGTHMTLGGTEVTVEGEGDDFSVPAEGTVLGESEASVVCGNVQTANATVYIIDQVLAPPAA